MYSCPLIKTNKGTLGVTCLVTNHITSIPFLPCFVYYTLTEVKKDSDTSKGYLRM